MSMELLAQLTHLTKRYGAFTALDDVSLDVRPGELLALVGPNGAGKTTALKLMAGLLAPTSGTVTVGGLDVHRQPDAVKRVLSFLPDQPFLYELLTVEEFLVFVGAVHRLPSSELFARVSPMLALFGLDEHRAQRIGQLSYGMKSRVALVSSLLHRPRLLVLDEPFFGLDPQSLRVIKQFLLDQVRQGMSAVISTHQLSIVEDVATRIAIVSRGRVIAVGTLAELKARHGGERLEELFFQLTTPTPSS